MTSNAKSTSTAAAPEAISPNESCTWQPACDVEQIPPNSGVCALVAGRQIAVFLDATHDEVFAVDNFDPISGAAVLSRGIIGSIGDETVVASPIYKQHFSLRTGVCLEQPEVAVSVYPVRRHNGRIELQVAAS